MEGQRIGNTIRPSIPEDHAIQAHPLSRVFAATVDICVVTGLVFAVLALWKSITDTQPSLVIGGGDIAGLLMYVVLGGMYGILMWLSPWSATLGKRLVGIKVLAVDANRIGPRQATIRYMALLLSVALFGIGFLRAFVADDRQTLHDSISGTCVLRAW